MGTGGLCINIGWEPQHVKDSELKWSDVPTCTADGSGMSCADIKSLYKSHSCCGNPNRRLSDKALAIASDSSAFDRDALLLEIGKRDAHIRQLEQKLGH